MSKLLLEIITPEAKTYAQEVDSVVMPTVQGQVQILPGHVPLMTLVEPGELHVINQNNHEYLAVGSGAVQITGNRVAVMTDMAVKESDIDLGKAEEAIRRYEDSAAINSLKFDRHAERTAVETFLKGIKLASDVFQKDPLGVPMISNWSRVAAAVPDIFDRLMNAVEEDHRWDPTK